VLAIDDEPDILRATLLRLGIAGYQTLSASNADDGLQIAEESLPDAILLDVRMAGMDGIEALRRLKAGAATRHIPVIMLSGSVPERQSALEAGARFYLMKPYKRDELLSAVQVVTRQKADAVVAPRGGPTDAASSIQASLG
jgi:CheY-like chemotaxis protein